MGKGRRTFGAALIGTWMRLKGRLPLGYHYAWGKVVAWLCRSVVRYRRDVVTANLARSFPEKKYGELTEVTRRFYAHFGDIFAETVWLAGCRGERGVRRFIRSGLVTATNPELLNGYYDAGRTAIVLSSHSGNWELLGSFFAMAPDRLHMAYDEVAVVHKRLTSPTWDRVFADNRMSLVAHTAFDGYVEAMEVLRYAVRRRETPMVYIFPNDQVPYGPAKAYDVGPFLHQATTGMAGGVALAHRFGMAVVYMRWTIRERGRYEVTYVPIAEDASASDTGTMIKEYYALLEADIRAQPWNYLWSHKRWK